MTFPHCRSRVAFLAAAVLVGVSSLPACSRATDAGEEEEEEEPPPSTAPGRVEGAREVPPLREIAFSDGGPSVSFFAIGDTGWGGPALAENAEAMERAAATRPVDLVLLLGDNFYRQGADSLQDPRWQTEFEKAFVGPYLQVPFYAVLGNHDHGGDTDIEIEYTEKSSRWHMPESSYTFERPLRGGGTVEFIAIDTQPLHDAETIDGFFLQHRIEASLERSTARWKIAFGHHPALSHGKHGGTAEFVEDVVPLFEKYGVDLYLSGHDHDLQLLDSGKGWLQIVSGAGSSTRDTTWGPDTLYATASLGYAWIGIGEREMWIEIATAEGGPQFRWRVEKR